MSVSSILVPPVLPLRHANYVKEKLIFVVLEVDSLALDAQQSGRFVMLLGEIDQEGETMKML